MVKSQLSFKEGHQQQSGPLQILSWLFEEHSHNACWPGGKVNISFGLHDSPVITQTAPGPCSVPGWLAIWLAGWFLLAHRYTKKHTLHFLTGLPHINKSKHIHMGLVISQTQSKGILWNGKPLVGFVIDVFGFFHYLQLTTIFLHKNTRYPHSSSHCTAALAVEDFKPPRMNSSSPVDRWRLLSVAVVVTVCQPWRRFVALMTVSACHAHGTTTHTHRSDCPQSGSTPSLSVLLHVWDL